MLLKVGRHSRPQQVAELIATIARTGATVEIRVIGADALNRAIKGIIVASTHLAAAGMDLAFLPSFDDVEVDGKTWSALRLSIAARPLRGIVLAESVS